MNASTTSMPLQSRLHAHSEAQLEIIAQDPQKSFRTLTHDFPSPIGGWVAHPEYEIHLIQESSGTLYTGDYAGPFQPGHLSIIGPMLPHHWVSDLQDGQVVRDRDVLVQFRDEWLRSCMNVLPETQHLDSLLMRSTRGIEFFGDTARRGGQALRELIAAEGVEQVAKMFELLAILADAPAEEQTLLASPWLGQAEHPIANAALEVSLSYIFDNLTGDVRLSKAAQLAYMSEATFSKYFKKASGLTFSTMVKRLRMTHARKLLETTDMTIAQVAAASGYHNMSNFNRQFLAEVGHTPSDYRKLSPSARPDPLVTWPETKGPPDADED